MSLDVTRENAPHFSIIIPAYNEAGVIASTLHSLSADGALLSVAEVLVICNGCADKTAKIARKAAPWAKVIEIEAASKTRALNTGLAHAKNDTIVFLDADIETSGEAILLMLLALICSGKSMAYGNAQYDLQHASIGARAFYKAWRHNPYFDDGKVGGMFALSKDALSRLGRFPNITNDDEWIRRLFMTDSIFVARSPYQVRLPRTLASLIAVRSRVYRGNQQLAMRGYPLNNQQEGWFKERLLKRPHLWPAALVYLWVSLCARVKAFLEFHDHNNWNQDTSTRLAPR